MTLPPDLTGYLSALGLGLLIGVVRERQRPADGHAPAGLRTHALAALGGAVAWQLGLPVFVALLLVAGLLAYSSDRRSVGIETGQTGEVALLLTVLLGGLAATRPGLAAALAVVAALLLQAREKLHRLGRELISESEVRDGLLLLAAALLVLPLLPDEPVGPGGALNPQKLWRLVVLVMAVSAMGHVALRVIGARRGLAVAGFFAGFVSSTAAIAGFGQRVRTDAALLRPSVAAAMFAALASLLLMLPVLATASASLASASLPMLGAFGTVLALGGVLGVRGGSGEAPAPTQESRMFRFGHALGFAALMAGVLLASALLGARFGQSGVVAAAFLAALAEVHAAAASIGQLVASGGADATTAQGPLLAVLGASVLARSVVAFASGGARYGARVAAGLALAWVAAALAWWWV
jgi:uncharacterized membrane protein (DUF4010 family)